MRRFSTLSVLPLMAAGLIFTAGCKGFEQDATATESQPLESSEGTAEGEPNDPNSTRAARAEASRDDESSAASDTTSTSDIATLRSVPDVVEKVLPGVVGISTTREMRRRAPGGFPFAPPRRAPGRGSPEPQGMGSGVIVSEDGLILTNNHVVEGADSIEVTLSTRDRFDAEIVGTDPKTDLAVLRMTSPPEDLQPLKFGDSSDLRLGEGVIAIGNPFGLSSTVTKGIISAQGRGNVGIAEYEDFIQTDAAINPGNSGGALINLDGELVGINTAILSRTGASNGIGFAIPSKMARSIMESLVADGEVRRGYLGVLIQTVEDGLAQGLGIPADTTGVAISDVRPGSPAEKSGLQRHDVITRVGDAKVQTASELRNEVAFTKPGTNTTFTVLRDGAEMKLDVRLGELPGQADRPTRRARPEDTDTMDAIDGLKLAPITREVRARFDIPTEIKYGLLIAGVAPGSTPARAGLRPGDIVIEVDRKPVKTPTDFASRVEEATGDEVLLLAWRRGHTVFVPLPLE